MGRVRARHFAGICRAMGMKFTILSHAGMSVEHNGVQVVCDPWLVGSCYWRSWWNFPEPPAGLLENLRPDYVYLTHLHWDHFHGATLKKLFDPSQRFLVPRVPTRRMVEDLAWLGFHNVTEIPHGGTFELGEDFSLHSFQFGVSVDSAAVFSGGGHVIFNCNDCKYFGLPLRQITRRFPKIDFVLRSHSSASPIPYCVEGYAEQLPPARTPQDYIDEFSRFALHIGARYAIPFASNHCFLHRDTFHFNHTAVSAGNMQAHYQQLASRLGSDSECVVMAPGSSWSESEGFSIVPFDYQNRDQYLEQLLQRHRETLAQQYEKEAQALADFDAFRRYFEGLLRAVPSPLRRLLKIRLAFRTSDPRGEHNWLIDLARDEITALDGRAGDCPTLETPALVLNDCATVRMFSTWSASKRLKIHLPAPQHLRTVNLFFTLLDLYETDVLPLSRSFSRRALGIRLLRWREAAEAANLVFRHKLLRRPFVISGLYPLPPAGRAGLRAPGRRQL
jgi:UDP-MurNAc hydroxylase